MAVITGETLRTARLAGTSWGVSGYAATEVDAFLDRAAVALDELAAGRAPGMTAEDVSAVRFSVTRFRSGAGYAMGPVDDLLDEVAVRLRAAAPRPTGGTLLNGRPWDGGNLPT